MAQSSFKIEKTDIPVPVSKGGTGATSLTNKGVLVGAGTSSVTSIAPGASGNSLVSNGTSWSSGVASMGDKTVSYSKLASEMTAIVSVSASDIDWSAGSIFTKTLTGNTTLTFSNYKLDKNILLQISGDFTLSLPSTVNILNGTYSGRVMNYITLHCTKSTATEEVWGTINQRFSIDYGYGYLGGGFSSSGYVLTTDRIVFSSGVTSANTISNLSTARGYLAGLSDKSTYGYFSGGGYYFATSDRISFSTGATSANTASNLSLARNYLAGLSDGSTYGYFAGGNSGAYVATADRVLFSTSATSANAVSNLSLARSSLAGLSDGSTYGYFAGGNSGTYVAAADRVLFSTSATSANAVSNLSLIRDQLTGLSDGSTYGYFVGGYNSSLWLVNADRIVFSTGVTSANTVSNLPSGKYNLSGISDGATYGYFIGGNNGGYSVTADRIVFSTGVTSANTVSNISVAKEGLAGVSSVSV